MNSELRNQLAAIIAKLTTAVQTAADFTIAQLPDVVYQYLLYGRVYATLLFLVWLVLFSASLTGWLKFGVFSKATDRFGEWSEARICWTIIGGVTSPFLLVLLIFAAKSLILVWLAPKVWLLKEFAGLLK